MKKKRIGKLQEMKSELFDEFNANYHSNSRMTTEEMNEVVRRFFPESKHVPQTVYDCRKEYEETTGRKFVRIYRGVYEVVA